MLFPVLPGGDVDCSSPAVKAEGGVIMELAISTPGIEKRATGAVEVSETGIWRKSLMKHWFIR